MAAQQLLLMSFASGLTGADPRCGEGPLHLQKSPYLAAALNHKIAYQWGAYIHPDMPATANSEKIVMMSQALAQAVAAAVTERQVFAVIGGDHSSAIGTWSGAYDALHTQGEIGLIWIDAHMDSHTPQTTITGRIHGMPLAILLGQGQSTLTTLLHPQAKIKPQNLCLIGVRSYEVGEAELLQRMNVRIYLMEEVKRRGLQTVLEEAKQIVTQHTIGFGISLDLDSIDPLEAPAVDVPEPDGLHFKDLHAAWATITADPRLIGIEIVEFDPSRDHNEQTEKLMVKLLATYATSQGLLLNNQ